MKVQRKTVKFADREAVESVKNLNIVGILFRRE